MEAKACSDVVTYTSFSSLSSLLSLGLCKDLFRLSMSLLRHEASEQHSAEQDRDAETHPHSGVQSAPRSLPQQKRVPAKSWPGTQEHFQAP